MKIGLAHVGAVASVLGLMVWLVLGQPERSTPEDSDRTLEDVLVLRSRTEGSAVPCAVPLGWRLARVDERFGLDPERARAVVEDAAALWEEAANRALFVHDPEDGFPIRFVYGERQVRTEERSRRERAFRREARRIDDRRAALDSLVRRHSRLRERHERRLGELERRASEHNMTVREWDRRGGAPRPVRRRLAASADSLKAERRELAEQERELDALRSRVREERKRLRRRLEEHDRRGDALERAFPPVPVESGLYREAVGREGDRVASVRREIRVYRYDGLADLERIVVHELGHALGLGHAETPGAVMSGEYGKTDERSDGAAAGEPGAVELRPADLELLSGRCPDL